MSLHPFAAKAGVTPEPEGTEPEGAAPQLPRGARTAGDLGCGAARGHGDDGRFSTAGVRTPPTLATTLGPDGVVVTGGKGFVDKYFTEDTVCFLIISQPPETGPGPRLNWVWFLLGCDIFKGFCLCLETSVLVLTSWGGVICPQPPELLHGSDVVQQSVKR